MTGREGAADPPSRHAGVTMACPACGRAMAAPVRRHSAAGPVLALPARTSRVPLTVYACDDCDMRAVGEQRCAGCWRFMRRVGIGGACPGCDQVITVVELIGPHLVRWGTDGPAATGG